MKRQMLVAILLTMSFATSLALAQKKGPVRLQIPQDITLPYFARIGGATEAAPWQEIYHNDEWAAIVFYYEPTNVPPDFNLLLFYNIDPNLFPIPLGPNLPMTVAGFVVWDPDAMNAFGPWSQENIHGLGAVPVWFVSWPELQTAISDGILTVPELEDLGSLRRGTAALYQEVLHPLKHITMNAEGLLEDGRRFQFHATGTGVPPADCCYGPMVHIRIW